MALLSFEVFATLLSCFTQNVRLRLTLGRQKSWLDCNTRICCCSVRCGLAWACTLSIYPRIIQRGRPSTATSIPLQYAFSNSRKGEGAPRYVPLCGLCSASIGEQHTLTP